MTPTPEIRKAFYERLLCSLPVGPVGESDIAWPNMPFIPQVERMYIAPWLLFADTVTASLSPEGFEKLSGVFQVSVYGVVNSGEAEIESVARELTDIFRGGTLLQIPGFNPVHIRNAYRSSLDFASQNDGSVKKGSGRPVITVSANWHQYTQKGE